MKQFLKKYTDISNGVTHSYVYPDEYYYNMSDKDKKKVEKKYNIIEPGEWNIPDNKLIFFYKNYIKEHDKGYSFVERIEGDTMPLIINLYIYQKCQQRIFNSELLKSIMNIADEEISFMIQEEDLSDNVYVLQALDMCKYDGYYIDNVYIVYPQIAIKMEYHQAFREKLMVKIKNLLISNENNIQKFVYRDPMEIKRKGMPVYMCHDYIDDQRISPCILTNKNNSDMLTIMKDISIRNRPEISCYESYIKQDEFGYYNGDCDSSKNSDTDSAISNHDIHLNDISDSDNDSDNEYGNRTTNRTYTTNTYHSTNMCQHDINNMIANPQNVRACPYKDIKNELNIKSTLCLLCKKDHNISDETTVLLMGGELYQMCMDSLKNIAPNEVVMDGNEKKYIYNINIDNIKKERASTNMHGM